MLNSIIRTSVTNHLTINQVKDSFPSLILTLYIDEIKNKPTNPLENVMIVL